MKYRIACEWPEQDGQEDGGTGAVYVLLQRTCRHSPG